jgi:hypothetical protein
MRKAVIASSIATLVMACGPEAAGDDDDDDDGPPGGLVYELPIAKFYRLDRRVDIVAVDPMLSRSGCGFLTDRAYYDLIETVDALDPSEDYGWSDCFPEYDPDGLLHLEGFTHSPFPCNWYCCHPDLIRAATVYWAAASNLYGQEPTIDDVPYVALEPDRPCP